MGTRPWELRRVGEGRRGPGGVAGGRGRESQGTKGWVGTEVAWEGVATCRWPLGCVGAGGECVRASGRGRIDGGSEGRRHRLCNHPKGKSGLFSWFPSRIRCVRYRRIILALLRPKLIGK